LAQKQGVKLIFNGIQPSVRNVIQIAHLEEFLLNDDAPEAISLPNRPSTWRDVFSLPEAASTPTPIFGTTHDGILPEPVTNAVLATSHE
jgi:hypothetical protein